MKTNNTTQDNWMRMATQEAIDAISRVPAMEDGDKLLQAAVDIIKVVPDETDRMQLVGYCAERFDQPMEKLLRMLSAAARQRLEAELQAPLPTLNGTSSSDEPLPFD